MFSSTTTASSTTMPMASASPALDCRVEAFEFHAGVGGGELPVDAGLGLVPGFLPGGHFSDQRRLVTDPPVEALPGQHRQFRLGHVQPTAMFGGVVDLQLVDQSPGFGRREPLVQRRHLVRVQVVHHQHDLLGRRVLDVDQVADHLGEIDLGTAIRDRNSPPAPEWLERHEQVDRAVPLVLVIPPGGTAGLRRHRRPRLPDQLLRLLVQADDRPVRVVRPVVDVEDVLHRTDEVRVLLRGQNPLLPQPRLDRIVFSVVRTVSSPIASTTFNSTNLSAKSDIVHRPRPAGGVEHASFTNWASWTPSSFRYWRFGDGFRDNTASNPFSTNPCRVRSTVRTPTSKASAICASGHAGPCSPSSAFSRIIARFRNVLDPFPRSTIACNCVRSASSNRTTYLATLPMTGPPEGRQETTIQTPRQSRPGGPLAKNLPTAVPGGRG